jgi:hypothetical protein
MDFGDFSGLFLDDEVLEALHEAALQVRGGPQHYLGVEHLLLAILKNGEGESPANRFLRTLRVNADDVRQTLEEKAVKGSGPPYAEDVLLTSECRLVLRMACELRGQRKAQRTDTGHVTEAATAEGRSLAAWSIYNHLTLDPEEIEALHPPIRRGLRVAGKRFGAAWELPLTAEASVDRFLDFPGWDRRCGPYTRLRQSLWHQMTCSVYQKEDKLRVLVTPGKSESAAGRWLNERALHRKSSELAAIPGARRMSSALALKDWPRTVSALAGRLQRDFILSRKPAGCLRLLAEADLPFCRDLYDLFEERRQVPHGFGDSFGQWLEVPDTLRLAIEFEGSLAGCGGFNLREEPNPESEDAPKLATSSLSFGLVHPRFQRHGLGNTLLGFRMAASHRMGHSICSVEGTTCSIAYLERAGFRFWQTRKTPEGEPLFSGAMVLSGDDVRILEAWLGPERMAVLCSLTPPPVKVMEAA